MSTIHPNKRVQTCQSKTINNEPILSFWWQFLWPYPPWHIDITKCQVNFLQIQHPRCIIYDSSWGIGWWSKNTIKYYVKKRRLYQHRPGSFIQECIIMVMPTRNGKILKKILWKQQNTSSQLYYFSTYACINNIQGTVRLEIIVTLCREYVSTPSI